MEHAVQDKVARTMEEEGMVRKGELVLAAFSGGPDSTALADILHRLAPKLGFSLALAHVNHGIRGEEADQDEKWAKARAEEMGLPIVIKRAGPPPAANLEEWARNERYRLLCEAARELAAHKIATGHHADDALETMLMNLIRGSGIHGLSALAAVQLFNLGASQAVVIRPLIRVFRREIEEYLSRRGLRFREDSSNQDPAFLRNRIRHELIPLLETMNPQARRALYRAYLAVSREGSRLGEQARAALKEAASRSREGLLLDLKLLAALPPALRYELYRQALKEVRGSLRGVSFRNLAALDRLVIKGPAHGRLDLPDITARREYERLFLSPAGESGQARGEAFKEQEQTGIPLEIELPAPGRVEWPGPFGPLLITASLETRPAEVPDPFESAWLDPGLVSPPLKVRARKPGDRFQPEGFPGTRKLKDIMNELKIPPPLRDRWPLIADASRILWVPGLRPAHPLPREHAGALRITIKPRLYIPSLETP